MSDILLNRAVSDFLRAPTQANRDNLISAADAYRDWWIEAQVSGSGAASPGLAQRSAATLGPVATTSYDKELSTSDRLVGGIPVRLVLQRRTSAREDDSWWVISWRTRLRAGGPNRRFYKTQETYWSIPAGTALELILELEAKGALGGEFDDARSVEPLKARISDDLPPAERLALLNEITGPEEDWGAEPLFVVADDPNPDWRKVMIVNRVTGMATFRSLTRSTSYRPRTELRPGSVWSLDNSMMDAGAQQVRTFLATLATWRHEGEGPHI